MAAGNVSSLPQLQARFPRWLPLERVFRIILTYLPESTEPRKYTSVLQELLEGSHTETHDVDVSAVKGLSDEAARTRVRKLRLLPLKYPDDEDTLGSTDLLTQFLIHRAHRIDSETALQPLILDLLLPFYQHSATLRTWLICSLLPLLRLNYEYYPSQDETFSLDILESMDDNTAINVLLSMTSSQKNDMDLARNLRGLLGPWMFGSNRSKRRRLNQTAQQTSITLSQDESSTEKGTSADWQSVNEWLLSRSLIDHESTVNAYVHWDGPEDVDLGGYNEEKETMSSEESIRLRTRNDEAQMLELRAVIESVVKQTKTRDWRKSRQQLLWLWNWQGGESQPTESPAVYHGLFWRVPRNVVEAEILKALLEVREYDLAVDIYVTTGSALSSDQVEEAIKEAIFTAYDNASNGNRTRGGMKRASDIIRVHPDPLSLIEKVLDQNPKAYTKLDDLLGIGRNLVAAGFSPRQRDENDEPDDIVVSTEPQDPVITAERRIMSLAISSALSSDDFGTAYSYILTRLTPPSLISTSSPLTNPEVKDDISWRAVYNAGRYRAPASSSPNLQSQISQLSQRMELLSLALVLVPYPDPLPEILGAWRRCDEELNVLRARESEEEEIWDAKGDRFSTVPGGFGPTDSEQDAFETKQRHARRARAQQSRVDLEEAPMGLFEVARGAAMALHKNAFPLRGAASDAATASHEVGDGESAQERVRKRDVVSNMVTGGLASGIGWVLGAQPVNR
ncbi:hypothetical protein ATERTT37_006151 [Aspergillus terreus]